MADKKDDKKKDDKKKEVKKSHHSGGEMSFGMEIVLFLVALFIIWALFSKPSENADKPFIKATTTPTTSQK